MLHEEGKNTKRETEERVGRGEMEGQHERKLWKEKERMHKKRAKEVDGGRKAKTRVKEEEILKCRGEQRKRNQEGRRKSQR